MLRVFSCRVSSLHASALGGRKSVVGRESGVRLVECVVCGWLGVTCAVGRESGVRLVGSDVCGGVEVRCEGGGVFRKRL